MAKQEEHEEYKEPRTWSELAEIEKRIEAGAATAEEVAFYEAWIVAFKEVAPIVFDTALTETIEKLKKQTKKTQSAAKKHHRGYQTFKDFDAEHHEELDKFFADNPGITDEEVLNYILNYAKLKGKFYNVPSSSALNMIEEMLASGTAGDTIARRKSQYSNSKEYEIATNGKNLQIKATDKKESVYVQIDDIARLTKSNKNVKKILIYLLVRANEQCIANGEVVNYWVMFSPQELVDAGIYSRIDSAKRGFLAAADVIPGITVKGYTQRGKKRVEQAVYASLIPTIKADKESGLLMAHLNEDLNWNFAIQYFTTIPKYYFKLSNRAGELLLYIFYLARQNTKEIKERGYFHISIKAIRTRLNLPSPGETQKPRRDIIDAIDKALEEIETAHSEQFGNRNFQLLVVNVNINDTVYEYIQNGRLRVTMKSEFAAGFINIAETTKIKQTAAKQKSDRIKEKAIAENLAKKMENNNK